MLALILATSSKIFIVTVQLQQFVYAPVSSHGAFSSRASSIFWFYPLQCIRNFGVPRLRLVRAADWHPLPSFPRCLTYSHGSNMHNINTCISLRLLFWTPILLGICSNSLMGSAFDRCDIDAEGGTDINRDINSPRLAGLFLMIAGFRSGTIARSMHAAHLIKFAYVLVVQCR